MDARLNIDKTQCMVDEVVVIGVNGAKPNSYVTLVATLTEVDMGFFSFATFKTDNLGNVDISKSPSVNGSYTGVHAMGLFWSMRQQPGQAPGRRLMKRDVTTPLVITLSLFKGHVDGEVTLDPGYRAQHCVTSAVCYRWYMREGVVRVPVKEGRLKGTFFLPPGDGPFPGVVDMFGTVGGTVEYRAALLASRGFAAFALCYFNPREDDMLVQDLEYYEAAVEHVLAQNKVSQSGVGVIGVSKGSDMAYLLAIVSPKVRAAITIGGYPFNTLLPHTYKREVFHCNDVMESWDITANFRENTERYLSKQKPKPAAYFPVERSQNAHFLVIHGDDDQSNPPLAITDIPRRLRAHGKSNYETILYRGAGHLIEPPFSPVTIRSYHGFLGAVVEWGGDPPMHAHAQEDSWLRIQNFIRKHVPLTYEKNYLSTESAASEKSKL